LELQILSYLWRHGPSKAREVLDSLPDGKRRAYTSILSAMQEMEKKGMLAHDVERNTYVYRAAVTKKQVLAPWLRAVVQNIFGGSPAEAMAHLLEHTDVSEEELAEIRKLIGEASSSRDQETE
jgi:predicted transcriptional regulator